MIEVNKQAPNKTHGLLGALGGALIITSYFLPTYAVLKPGASQPITASDYTLISNWDVIYHLINPTTYDPRTGGYVASQPSILPALLAAFPMIMAVLILALGVWAFFKRPGPTRNAFFSTSAVFLTFSLITAFNIVSNLGFVSALYIYANNPYQNPYQNQPLLTSLGNVVFAVGIFIAIVSAFIAWGHKEAA